MRRAISVIHVGLAWIMLAALHPVNAVVILYVILKLVRCGTVIGHRSSQKDVRISQGA